MGLAGILVLARKITVMAPVSLHGLHKVWTLNDELTDHCKANGVRTLIQTYHPKQAIAKKDVWHAVHNRDTVQPIIFFMRRAALLKTPYLDDLVDEVAAFAALIQGKQLDADTLAQIKQDQEVDLHCVASSIKKILSFLRNRFLRSNTPRDPGVGGRHGLSNFSSICLSFHFLPAIIQKIVITAYDQKNSHHG